MTILPITGAAEDVLRITEASVDGFIVWTTSDDDPVVAAARSTRRPAVVHGRSSAPWTGAGEH
jgi:DNA-binding LacI/PurR family transcriptional regulator